MNQVQEKVIHMYAAREPIYPREAKGKYATLRWVFVWLTQLLFYGVPWLSWNGRQAVLFDLVARKFYIFGLVLWPQDFIFLAALLIICALSLFLATAVAGRVWCGFTCPQTVYTEIFLWIERKAEGSRSMQMRRDAGPPTLERFLRKAAKHAGWGVVALWTGFTFVSYFTPLRTLESESLHFAFGPWESFWILFYALATYGNAGWLREQVCKYMCPYARFQSAMFDKDTLIITYDNTRKDCIDCTVCVQVCPVGIDIRKGLQYECIGCAACVDACNVIMDKVDKPRGLIRYWTERAMKGHLPLSDVARRVLRPRVLIYSAVLWTMVLALGTAIWMRTELKVDVIRDRGAMGREVENGAIENVYRLQLMNTTERAHSYRIRAEGLSGLKLATDEIVRAGPTETLAVPVRLRAPHGEGKAGSNKIRFIVEAIDNARLKVEEEAVFLIPR